MPSRFAFPAFALVLACGAQPAPAPTSPTVTASPGTNSVAADSLRVTVTPDSTSIHSRQPLRLTIRVENTGATSQSFDLSSGCVFDYEVLSSSGEVLGSADQMCTAVMGRRAIAAGASFSDVLVWVPGRPGNVSPAPGRYAVRGVLLRAGAPVRSATVPIEVLP